MTSRALDLDDGRNVVFHTQKTFSDGNGRNNGLTFDVCVALRYASRDKYVSIGRQQKPLFRKSDKKSHKDDAMSGVHLPPINRRSSITRKNSVTKSSTAADRDRRNGRLPSLHHPPTEHPTKSHSKNHYLHIGSHQPSRETLIRSLSKQHYEDIGVISSRVIIVPDEEEDYPEPVPPSKTKGDIFCIKDYKKVDKRASQAPRTVSHDFDDLLEYLLKDLNTDLAKLRAIYRWITSQSLPVGFAKRDIDDDTPLGFLLNIREKKATYAELFAKICRLAGLRCAIVYGVAKGLAYDVGCKVTQKKMKNSWNAVYIEDSWFLVHPYWAAHSARGYCTGRWAVVESDSFYQSDDDGDSILSRKQEIANQFNDFYFLTDPYQFITKCYPDDSEWQLMDKTISISRFEELPFLQPAFYELGLKLKSHNTCVVHSESGKVEISIAVPKAKAGLLEFAYKLFKERDNEGEGEYETMLMKRYLLHHKRDNIEIFEVRFPIGGIYKLEIHCTDPELSLPSDWICDFRLVCQEPMAEPLPLPVVPSIGWGPGMVLESEGIAAVSHGHGVVSLDDTFTTSFTFMIKGDRNTGLEAELLHNQKSKTSLRNHVTCEEDDGQVVFEVTPPSEGEYALQIFAKPENDEDKRKNVCNYILHRTQIVEEPQLSSIRQKLVEATESGDVEAIASWLESFVATGMDDRGDLTKAKKKLYLARLNKEISEAIVSKDLDRLERTLNSVSGTSIKRALGSLVDDAEAMRSRLRRLKRLQHAVLEMDQKTISELRSYPKPPHAVHGVMVATFLLLGAKENDIKKWSKVQGLISKTGKGSLKRKVAEFKPSSVRPAVMQRARDILNRYDLETVQITSAGAATFYQWAVSMVGEIETELEKVD